MELLVNIALFKNRVKIQSMKSAFEKLLILVYLAMASYLPGQESIGKEITEKVIVHTELDELAAAFCAEYCLGNEKRGYIKDVAIEANKTGKYNVSGKAVLQNRQVFGEPYEFVLYDHTVILNVDGTLNPETCKLRIDKVSVENDFEGIFESLLKSQGDIIGREEDVPDCKTYIGQSKKVKQ